MFFKLIPKTILPLVLICFIQFSFAQSNTLEFKRGHQGWLNAYTLSQSNKYVVTAGSDNELILWDYTTGKQIREIKGQAAVTTLVVSPDDRYLFSADTASRVKKWDLQTGKLLFELSAHAGKIPLEEDGWLEEVEIKQVDIESFKDEFLKNQVKPKVDLYPDIELLVSSNGQFLISGGRDATIKVWDAKTGKQITSFVDEAQNGISSLLLTKNMKYLISEDNSSRVIIRSYPSGKIITKFTTHARLYKELLSKDQEYLTFLTDRYNLKKIRLSDGQEVFTKKMPHHLFQLINAADDTKIIGTSWPDTTFYINAVTGVITDRGTECANAYNFSMDLRGHLLFMNTHGKKLIVFDPISKARTERIGVLVPDIQSIKFSDDAKYLMINDAEYALDLIRINKKENPSSKTIPLSKSSLKHHSQFSPDTKQLAVITADGDLSVWNIENLTSQSTKADSSFEVFSARLNYDIPLITDLTYSSDGGQIIISDNRYGLGFVNVQKPSEQLDFDAKIAGKYNLVQLHRDSSHLLLVNNIQDGLGDFMQFDLRDLSKGNIPSKGMKSRFRIRSFKERLTDFDFSQEYTMLSYHSKSGEAGVVEVQNSKNLVSFSHCSLVKWIGSNKRFILFQSQLKVLIWDAVERKIALQYNLPFLPLYAAVHPSGQYLVVVRPDHGIEFRNTLDGELLLTLYWRSGVPDFYIKNKQGQNDPQAWKNLYSTVQANNVKSLEIQLLERSQTQANKPTEVEEIILNIGHLSGINLLGLHQDGKHLFTTDTRNNGKIWDLASGRELRSIVHPALVEKPFIVANSGATKMTLIAGYKKKWHLDLKSGEIEEIEISWEKEGVPLPKNYSAYPFEKHGMRATKFILPNGDFFEKPLPQNFGVNHIAFNADKGIVSFIGFLGYGNDAIISYYGKTYQDSLIINLKPFRERWSLIQYWVLPGTDSLVAKNGDGRMVVFHPLNKTFSIRPFIDNTPLATLAFSQDGRIFARAILEKGTVEVWDNASRKLLAKRIFPGVINLTHLTFNQIGSHLVLSDGLNIWNWDLKQDSLHQFTNFRMQGARQVHILPTGNVVFNNSLSSFREGLRLFNLYTGNNRAIPTEGFQSNEAFYLQDKILVKDRLGQYLDVLHPDDSYFFDGRAIKVILSTIKGDFYGFIHGELGEFVWWDIKKAGVVFSKKEATPFFKMSLNSAETLIALNNKTHILIIDAITGLEKLRIPFISNDPRKLDLQFSGDSRFLFINEEEDVIVWNLGQNIQLNKFKLGPYSTRIIGATNEGQMVYVQTDNYVRGFDQRGKEVFSVEFNEGDFTSRYFPAEHKIIVVNFSGVLQRLDANTGDIEKTIYLGRGGTWITTDQEKKVQTSPTAANDVHVRTRDGQIAFLPKKPDTTFATTPALLTTPKVVADPSKKVENPINKLDLVNEVWKTQFKSVSVSKTKDHLKVNALNVENQEVVHVHITPDEQRLIFQLKSGQLLFVEKSTLRLLKTITVPQMVEIKSVMSVDGRYLACLSKGQNILVYNSLDGSLIGQKNLEHSIISALTMSNDGRKLVIGTIDGGVLGLNLPDLSIAFEIWPSSKKIQYLSINGAGDRLACIDADQNIRVYDLSALQKILFFSTEKDYGPISQVIFGPQQNLVIAAEKRVYTRSYVATDSPLNLNIVGRDNQIFPDHSSPYRFYYYDSWSLSNYAYHFDITKGQKIDSFKNVFGIFCIAKSGQFAVINGTGYSGQSLQILDMQSRQKVQIKSLIAGIDAIALMGNTLYYKNRSEYYPYVYKLDLRNSSTEKLPGVYREGAFLLEQDKISHVGGIHQGSFGYGKKILGDTNVVTWIAPNRSCPYVVSENGQYLVLLCRGVDTVVVYSSINQGLIRKFPLSEKNLNIHAISNDGKWVVFKPGNDWRGIRIYDLAENEFIHADAQSIGATLFTKDGNQVILRYLNKYMVYDLNSRKFIKEIHFDTKLAYPLFIFANARYGIVYSDETSYQLFDLAKGVSIGAFHFFNLPNHPPAWVFIGTDGRYDGSTEGLTQLYTVDANSLRSQDIDYKTDPKYQSGLLQNLLK